MYKITNTSSKPVFVEGVALEIGESASVSEITDMMKYIARKGTIMISSNTGKESNAKILTEEGTDNAKKKKRSSKNLNE